MKYINEYLKDVTKIKPLGELTTKDDELNGMSGEMVYIDGKCSDIFISHADYANWLEKQSEQKSADKIEPKFHEGDFIKHNNASFIYKVISVNSDSYYIENIETGGRNELFYAEQWYHLWTIQDAKDGDVLYYKSESGIEYIVVSKGINKHGNIDSYFRYNSVNGFGIDIPSVLSVRQDNVTPATKEQRDTLFTKMHEAGYEWDADKKELKLLITNGGDFCFESENREHKPESITDEWIEDYWQHEKVNNPYSYDKGEEIQFDHQGFIRFCKKYCKKPAEWSEEDEKCWSIVIAEFSKCAGKSVSKDEWMRCNDFLHSLKDKRFSQSKQQQDEYITDEELLQARKDAYNDALNKIEYHSDTPTFIDGWSAAIWYLKKRNAMPSQRRWKPSDEQLAALDYVRRSYNPPASEKIAWDSLKDIEIMYWQLKKLKGE